MGRNIPEILWNNIPLTFTLMDWQANLEGKSSGEGFLHFSPKKLNLGTEFLQKGIMNTEGLPFYVFFQQKPHSVFMLKHTTDNGICYKPNKINFPCGKRKIQ